ncbi:MAG: hypothetical protein ABJB47_05190 [Actinomycetota bacterium]
MSEQLARIGKAIDELAAQAREPLRPAPGGKDTAPSLDDQLARIWIMVAELDPELARRVTSYSSGG